MGLLKLCVLTVGRLARSRRQRSDHLPGVRCLGPSWRWILQHAVHDGGSWNGSDTACGHGRTDDCHQGPLPRELWRLLGVRHLAVFALYLALALALALAGNCYASDPSTATCVAAAAVAAAP